MCSIYSLKPRCKEIRYNYITPSCTVDCSLLMCTVFNNKLLTKTPPEHIHPIFSTVQNEIFKYNV